MSSVSLGKPSWEQEVVLAVANVGPWLMRTTSTSHYAYRANLDAVLAMVYRLRRVSRAVSAASSSTRFKGEMAVAARSATMRGPAGGMLFDVCLIACRSGTLSLPAVAVLPVPAASIAGVRRHCRLKGADRFARCDDLVRATMSAACRSALDATSHVVLAACLGLVRGLVATGLPLAMPPLGVLVDRALALRGRAATALINLVEQVFTHNPAASGLPALVRLMMPMLGPTACVGPLVDMIDDVELRALIVSTLCSKCTFMQ